MNDDMLHRYLQSVGMAAFVTHLDLFRSRLSDEGAAAALEGVTGWQPNACRTRVSKARAIIAADQLANGLDLIARARVPENIQSSARAARAEL
jgi:hypothetical protein